MKHLKKINKKVVYRLIISSLIFLLIIAIAYIILKHFNLTNVSKEQIHNYISSLGIFGPIAYMLIVFLQVTFIPIPSAVTILAGSYLFGFWWSFFLSFIGSFLGSMFAFFLGRIIGRKFVDWATGSKEETDYYLAKLKGKETVLLFFMFILPTFPDDALCSIAGITNMKTWIFTIMQIITRPISILGTLLFMSGEIIPLKGWGIVLIIFIAIISFIAFVADSLN